MKRIKYFLKRLTDMNYNRMFEAVKEVNKKTGKNKLIILFDIIYSGIRYHAGYVDYLDFEFYNVPLKKRKTYITRGINYAYVARLSDLNARKRLENKSIFLSDFKDLIGREWLDVKNSSYDDFLKFFKKHKKIVAKPVAGMCGHGIQFYTFDENKSKEIYDKILLETTTVVEEELRQHEDLNRIHPHSINTVRVVTIQINGNIGIPFACLRTGNGNRVDNLNSGGFAARIDLNTGIINTPGVGKYNRMSEVHPVTGVSFEGFKIPMYDQIIELAKKAAKRVPEVGLIGWDVAVTDEGPILVEANDYPGHDIYQSPTFVGPNKIGMKPTFDKMIADLENKKH